jgi:hypothetical protein
MIVEHADGLKRRRWLNDDPLYVAYHDEEWRVPEVDDRALFELKGDHDCSAIRDTGVSHGSSGRATGRGTAPNRRLYSTVERDSKFGVGAHERIERKASVETARIRQDPGRQASNCCALIPPRNVSDVHHGRIRTLSQESQRTRRKAAHSFLEFRPSPPKFLERHLARSPRRSANDSRDTAAVVEQAMFILRLKALGSETGEMKDGPEPVAWSREIMLRDCSTRRRIDAAKDGFQASCQNVRLVAAHITLDQWPSCGDASVKSSR